MTFPFERSQPVKIDPFLCVPMQLLCVLTHVPNTARSTISITRKGSSLCSGPCALPEEGLFLYRPFVQNGVAHYSTTNSAATTRQAVKCPTGQQRVSCGTKHHNHSYHGFPYTGVCTACLAAIMCSVHSVCSCAPCVVWVLRQVLRQARWTSLERLLTIELLLGNPPTRCRLVVSLLLASSTALISHSPLPRQRCQTGALRP